MIWQITLRSFGFTFIFQPFKMVVLRIVWILLGVVVKLVIDGVLSIINQPRVSHLPVTRSPRWPFAELVSGGSFLLPLLPSFL